jgi:hypothetical protein
VIRSLESVLSGLPDNLVIFPLHPFILKAEVGITVERSRVGSRLRQGELQTET